MPFRLGKKAPRRLMSTPSLSDFMPKAVAWPPVAPRGWEYAVPDDAWGMLGNDNWGDCAEAGAMHLIQAQTANAGIPLHATEQQTLALYTALTGFDPDAGDPGSNPTDQGTDLMTVLQYWKKTGINVTAVDGSVVNHKILGYASLDVSSIAQIRYASDLFGGIYIGVNLPQSCEDNLTNWTYQQGSPIVGGHCVVPVGQGGAGGHLVSWGASIPFTWEFALQYMDEAYAVVSPEWVAQSGKSPSGMDLNGLFAALNAI
jgi:hypothetical protein